MQIREKILPNILRIGQILWMVGAAKYSTKLNLSLVLQLTLAILFKLFERVLKLLVVYMHTVVISRVIFTYIG